MTDNYLHTLDDLDDWELVNSDQDIRGCSLQTRSGEPIGTITRMLVDRDSERVAVLVIDSDRVLPIEDVEIRDGVVIVDNVRDMPGDITMPAGPSDIETVIPIVAEELAVEKRLVKRGGIRVTSRIVEQPVHEAVTLREEHVHVERRRADGPPESAGRLFEERTVEVRATDEEAVVVKDARVVEEVVVRKDVDERTETIDDTVRRTEVDIDRLWDADQHAGSDRRDARH